MKCPHCWTEKVVTRQVERWKKILLACLLLRPMKCNHCYHKFVTFWLLTIGKRVRRPSLRIAPTSRKVGSASGARNPAAARTKRKSDHSSSGRDRSNRADAA